MSGKQKRPLRKAGESGETGKPREVRIIGSQSVGEISPDILEQLKAIDGGGGSMVSPEHVPVKGNSTVPGGKVKKARVSSTSIQDIQKSDGQADTEVAATEISTIPVSETEISTIPTQPAQPAQPAIPAQPAVELRPTPPQSQPQQRIHMNTQPTYQVSHRAFNVPLPSGGVLYDGAYKNGMVEVRPMTTKEESILYSDGDTLAQLNKILNRCVPNPEIDLMEFLLQDRFAMFIYLRTFSYGSKYDIPFACSGCGYKKTITIDLMEDLSIKKMDEDAEEPFEADLPQSGHYIHFRLLRGKDEAMISKKAKRIMLQSMDEGDPSSIYRLALAIVGVDGVEMPNFEQKVEFVENLIPMDSNALRMAIEDVEGKIDTTVYQECPSCGLTNEFGMPFTAEFFRPSRK